MWFFFLVSNVSCTNEHAERWTCASIRPLLVCTCIWVKKLNLFALTISSFFPSCLFPEFYSSLFQKSNGQGRALSFHFCSV